jgi:two-component system, NarL family, response regulator LiaR
MAETIRVLIADDHALVRKGMMMFLGSCADIEVVGQAANGEEAVAECATLKPDVVLMDLMMPELDGIAATRAILHSNPQIRIIALTSFREDERIYTAVKAGIVGYLLKDCTPDELASAVRDVYAGKSTIPPEYMLAALRVAENMNSRQFHLSDREQDVLLLIVRGLSNRQIAQNLTLGESTVKFHVSNILSKLGVATRAEAVAMAIQQNLVE